MKQIDQLSITFFKRKKVRVIVRFCNLQSQTRLIFSQLEISSLLTALTERLTDFYPPF